MTVGMKAHRGRSALCALRVVCALGAAALPSASTAAVAGAPQAQLPASLEVGDMGDATKLLQLTPPNAHQATGVRPLLAAAAELVQVVGTKEPTTAQLLQQVSSLAQGQLPIDPVTLAILAGMKQSLNETSTVTLAAGLKQDQEMINRLAASAGSLCIPLNDSSVSTGRASLAACLDEQSSKAAGKRNAEGALSTYVADPPAPAAIPAERTLANVRAYFQSLTDYVATGRGVLDMLEGTVQNASAALSAQTNLCRSKQAYFEGEVCTVGGASVNVCNNYERCYSAAEAAYQSALPGLQASEAARKAQYVATQKSMCNMDILMSSDSLEVREQRMAACSVLIVNTDFLNVTYPSLSSQTACTPITILPCTPAFKSNEYDKYTEWASELAAACNACR